MSRIFVPSFCPSCGEALEMTETELFCRNTEDCPAQNSRRVLNFVSTMKIKGLGEKSVDRLYEQGFITSIPDIYRLSGEILAEVLGAANGTKVLAEIEASKRQNLAVFIQALGIKSIGAVAGKAIAEEIKDLNNFTAEVLQKSTTLAKTLGPVKYASLMRFFETTLYEEIMTLQLDLQFEDTEPVTDVKGYVCITGKLKDFSNRKSAEEFLARLGWVAKSSVTKEVTHLICEDSTKTTSSSYKKALQKGIPIVTISDLTSS